ncbi:hypothetical protein LTS10_001624 [Elasticomyces elasticus]|nr:hypothetical protein LTS10_001624 [Elasticomyces elasticus]
MNRRARGRGGFTTGGAMRLTTERMNANFTPNLPIGEAKLDAIGIRNDSLHPFDKLSGNWAIAGRVEGLELKRDLTSNLRQRAARKRNETASPKTLQLRARLGNARAKLQRHKAAPKAASKTALAAKAEYHRIATERAAADEARVNRGDGGGDVAMRTWATRTSSCQTTRMALEPPNPRTSAAQAALSRRAETTATSRTTTIIPDLGPRW